jgi:hypothetical protein
VLALGDGLVSAPHHLPKSRPDFRKILKFSLFSYARRADETFGMQLASNLC